MVDPSDRSSVSAAAILASARALVKYRLLDPSATVSVSPCVYVSTPVVELYASCVLFSEIAALALASVKYRLDPSVRSPVSAAAILASALASV